MKKSCVDNKLSKNVKLLLVQLINVNKIAFSDKTIYECKTP